MEVLEEKENFLFNRKEVKVIVEAAQNPTYEEALDLLEKEFNVDKDLVVIKGVKGKFGRHTFLITAFIYKSKEDKEKFEPKKKEKKQAGQPQEQTGQAQPTQQIEKKAEEKPKQPAEEKK